jgi:hypothetical protein
LWTFSKSVARGRLIFALRKTRLTILQNLQGRE